MTRSRGLRVPKGTRVAWVIANQGSHFCQCGCGEAITLRTEHFNVGIPKYRHGHNPSELPPGRKAKPKPPRQSCECGCGNFANYGKRYLSGHNRLGHRQSPETRRKIREAQSGERSHRFGVRPHNYKGGVRRHGDGYIMRVVKNHPFGGVNGVVMEHRLVLEAHLRTTDPTSPMLVEVGGVMYLRRDVEVHHLNGVKDDNRIENLECMTKAEHARHHNNIVLANAARLAKR